MPKMHLTAKSVENLKPGELQQDFWDISLPRFGIRVSPQGKKTWTLLYRFERRLRRYTIGTFPDLSLADARQKARAALGDIARGIDPAAVKDAARRAGTFGELAADYLEQYAKRRKRSWAADERIINKEFLPRWKHRKLTDLKRRDIRDLIDGIVRRGSGIMANHALSLLKTMYRFAQQTEWIESSPCDALRLPTVPHRRDRVLTEDEIKLLWQLLETQPKRDAAILRLQLLTATRIGEVMSMRWRDVDLQAAWWTIPPERAKNGLSHRVALSTAAIELLESLKLTASGEWVFPAPRKASNCVQMSTLHKTVLRVRPKLNFGTHDLRHTAATYISREFGASRELLKRLLNHRDQDMTARYDHNTRDREVSQALEAWGRFVIETVAGTRSKGNVVRFSG